RGRRSTSREIPFGARKGTCRPGASSRGPPANTLPARCGGFPVSAAQQRCAPAATSMSALDGVTEVGNGTVLADRERQRVAPGPQEVRERVAGRSKAADLLHLEAGLRERAGELLRPDEHPPVVRVPG